MSYKYPKLETAVSKVNAFIAYHQSYKLKARQAASDYRGKRLIEEQNSLFEALKAQYKEAASAVSDCLAEIAQIKAKNAEKALFATPTADFQFLSLPVTLSRDQLAMLYRRNSKDALFCQALSQYAEIHYPGECDFTPETSRVPAACNTIAGVLKDFNTARGLSEHDISSVVEDVSWNLAGMEDALSEADSTLSMEE